MTKRSVTREHLKSILECSINTLEEFLSDLEVTRTGATAEQSDPLASGLVTHIGITGYVSGAVEFEMDRDTGLDIASSMFGRQLEELDEDGKSAIREFANMSVGNAVTKIRNEYENKEIDITPPSLFLGNDIHISRNVSTSPIRVPIKTNYGNIVLDVALETQ